MRFWLITFHLWWSRLGITNLSIGKSSIYVVCNCRRLQISPGIWQYEHQNLHNHEHAHNLLNIPSTFPYISWTKQTPCSIYLIYIRQGQSHLTHTHTSFKSKLNLLASGLILMSNWHWRPFYSKGNWSRELNDLPGLLSWQVKKWTSFFLPSDHKKASGLASKCK